MSNNLSAFSSNIPKIGNSSNNNAIIQPAASPSWTPQINERFRELASLNKGWDGYNAEKVDMGIINFAIEILNKVCDEYSPEPSIVPGTGGDLQIEWHTQEGSVELHVQEKFNVQFWTDDPEFCTDDEEIKLTTNFTLVMRLLKKINRSQFDGGYDSATSSR